MPKGPVSIARGSTAGGGTGTTNARRHRLAALHTVLCLSLNLQHEAHQQAVTALAIDERTERHLKGAFPAVNYDLLSHLGQLGQRLAAQRVIGGNV